MTAHVAILPTIPERQGPPTIAELNAGLDISQAFTDAAVTFGGRMEAFGQAAYRATECFRTLYLSFTMTKREHRRMLRNINRLNRRPPLIHNGRKPR